MAGEAKTVEAAPGPAVPGKGRAVAILILCQVAAMALWFSASAVVPALRAEVGLDPLTASLFTSAVQIGFVAGTLISALLMLPDRIDPRRLFAASAAVAAAANAAILLYDPASPAVIALRFATGLCMAGIYPVGMKLAATWARGDMGLMIGLLVGALTLGSASPHLFGALGGVDWRFTLAAASVSALAAAGLILFAGTGPNAGRSPPFDPRLALRAWTTRSLRLANLGYLGHMWELYAMWTWIALFLDASFRKSGSAAPTRDAALAAFATVAAGAAGCVLGGLAADRVGRTTVTMASLALSGSCAVAAGFLFGTAPALVVALCVVWGFAVVADSAQFSASIAELSDSRTVGTMLTMQTCIGFLLTLVTIHLTPWLAETLGWRWAFAFLVPGPLVGFVAMARLRASPDAARIAGGRR